MPLVAALALILGLQFTPVAAPAPVNCKATDRVQTVGRNLLSIHALTDFGLNRSWGPDGRAFRNMFTQGTFDTAIHRMWVFAKLEHQPSNGPAKVIFQDKTNAPMPTSSQQPRGLSIWPLDTFNLGRSPVFARELGAAGYSGSMNLSVGVADGPWSIAATYDYRGGNFIFRSGNRFQAYVEGASSIPSIPSQHEPMIAIRGALPVSSDGQDFQLVAFGRGGRRLAFIASETIQSRTSYYFRGLPSDVTRVEFQSRPYLWVTFQGVPTRPTY